MKTWKKYLANHHEGIGTVYERFMLNRFFEKFLLSHRIGSVLEAPIGGMVGVPGINSVFLSRRGIKVEINDTDRERLKHVQRLLKGLGGAITAKYADASCLPYADNSFDLVWNFGVLWFYPDADKLIREMARVSRRYVLLFIPNRVQLAYPLRKYVLEREIFRDRHLEVSE